MALTEECDDDVDLTRWGVVKKKEMKKKKVVKRQERLSRHPKKEKKARGYIHNSMTLTSTEFDEEVR